MRVLIITHMYAPGRNPRAFRWSAIAEWWAEGGHEVHVVTAAVTGLLSSEVINGVHVHRVGGIGAARVRRRLATPTAYEAATKTGEVHSSRSPRSKLRFAAKWLHDKTWKKVYWPDYAGLWILPALRAASRLVTRNDQTIVITVSLPFSGHVVGYLLRKRGLGDRWIMDVGDPFAFMSEAPTNNHFLYRALNFWVEGKFLRGSDGVSVTTQATLKRYIASFPGVVGKIVEIPPLVTPRLVESADGKSDGTVRLVYAGTLHRSIRSPARVLTLFSKMLTKSTGNLELHFYGNDSEVRHIFDALPGAVRQKVFLHGEVDRAAAVAAMRSANALVNIGNDTPYQLPSKLVEYAALGKPVVNVVARENDSSVAFFERHPCVVNVIGDQAACGGGADDVLTFLRSTAGRTCDCDAEWLSRFSLSSVTKQYEDLIFRESPTH